MVKSAIFYCMEQEYYARYLALRRDMLSAAQAMSTEERAKARTDIIEAATIYDVPGPGDTRELYTIKEGVAHIPVMGILKEEADVCDGFFDTVTTYAFIRMAAKMADMDTGVKLIRFMFSTGGGSAFGTDETAQVIAALETPTEAVVTGMAASAGYYLASQCDKIIATAPSTFFGSIGARMELVDFSGQDAQEGIKRYVLVSTDAPDKAPDFTKEEGRAKYVQELNDLHDVFVMRVMAGRDVDKKTVDEKFGKGGVLAARDALAVGMIDEIRGIFNNDKGQEGGKKTMNTEILAMSLEDFIAKNPTAKVAMDQRISAAVDAALKTRQDAMIAMADKLGPILKSAEYPEKLVDLGMEVFKGEVSMDSFDSTVAMLDMIREQGNSQAAQEGSAAQGDVGSGQPALGGGQLISSEADMAAAVAKCKAQRGDA